MGFTEDKLVCFYKSLTLSQYIYGVFASISINKSKKGNANTTTSLPKRHRNVHRESFSCAQHQAQGEFFVHPSIHRKKYNNNIMVSRTNTTQYQNSVLQKSYRIIRDGYVNKCTNPRRIETTMAAYQVEIQATKKDRKPNSTLYQQQRQPPLSKPHHLPSGRSVYSKPKISMA
jgi:hypothetical protein